MARRFGSESRSLEGKSGEVDLERAGIRKGDNRRNLDGILTSPINSTNIDEEQSFTELVEGRQQQGAEADFERDGIREGDNTRNPEGVLTSQTNATKKDTFARDITLETKEEIKGSLDKAVKILQSYNEMGESVCITYLGHTLYSTGLTLDDAYLEVMGMTKDEWIEEPIKKRRARNIDTDIDIDNIDEDGFNADGMDMDDIDVDNIDMDEIMKDVVDIEKEYSFDFDNSSSKEETQSVSNEQLADNKSEVHAEKAELPKRKATKSKSDTTKKRVDSRNNGAKVSKKLGEKLGQRSTVTVNYLVSLERQLKEELSLSSCSEEMRKTISEKMIGLTDLVAKIYKVTKSHVSNDKKKEKIEELVGDLDIVKLTVDLRSEISATKETLIKKAKEAAKNIKDKVTSESERKQENTTIHDEPDVTESNSSTEQNVEEKYNPETDTPRFDRKKTKTSLDEDKTEENIDEDKDPFDDEEEFEGDGEEYDDPDGLFETAPYTPGMEMIKHEKIGFFGRMKRFFSNLKGTYASGKKAEEREDAEEDIDLDDEPSVETQQESKAEYIKAGLKVMGKIRDILNAAIEDKSSREVTPNIIENVAERVATFSRDKKVMAMCKGIVKDVWTFTNAMTYNVGDYIITGGKKGVEAIRSARREGMDR